jgi:hypothetical protein
MGTVTDDDFDNKLNEKYARKFITRLILYGVLFGVASAIVGAVGGIIGIIMVFAIQIFFIIILSQTLFEYVDKMVRKQILRYDEIQDGEKSTSQEKETQSSPKEINYSSRELINPVIKAEISKGTEELEKALTESSRVSGFVIDDTDIIIECDLKDKIDVLNEIGLEAEVKDFKTI